jgi:uncharacterized peroxidase-related enzyme
MMAWISTVPPGEAGGELRALYDDLERKRGKIAHILEVQSLRPRALKAHIDLYMDLMFASGGISRRERELMAVTISWANNCEYCTAHHRQALAQHVRDRAFADAVSRGAMPHEATARERALASYAVKLTTHPGGCTGTDIESLRAVGLGDEEILLANLIVSYFNFVNRIALGLGVAFDEQEVAGYHT